MKQSPLKKRPGGHFTLAAWRERVVASRRRLRFTQGGAIFTLGTLAIGLAGVNTGNNLLYLLLGAMLGFIGVSGILSDQVLRGLEVRRHRPAGIPVHSPVPITYEVRNLRRRSPTVAIELSEEGLTGVAFIPWIRPGASAHARSENSFVRRGVYPLPSVTISTSFPFGLFRKERDIRLPDELVIWPATDQPVAGPDALGGAEGEWSRIGTAATGARGEYRGLRDYRPGDDSRDIHWRATARAGKPVVREYEREEGNSLWICLDTRGAPGDAAEVAVERAASLAAIVARGASSFGFATSTTRVAPGRGAAQLEEVLDALARVDFRPDDPPVAAPADPSLCIFLGAEAASGEEAPPPATPR